MSNVKDQIYKNEVEKNQKIPSDFSNTCSTIASKATFIAGFTYYQIGRYGFTPYNDTLYIVFATTAFAGAVTCATVCLIFIYYLDSCSTIEKKMLFCEKTRGWVRAVTKIYILSGLSYILALGRIGFSYYDYSNFILVPQITMVIIALYYFYCIYFVVKSQLSMQFHKSEDKFSSKVLVNALDQQEFVNIKKIEDDHPQYSKRLGDPYNIFFVKESNTIASRSLFIANLAQNSVMRYLPEANESNILCSSFIFWSSITAATALVSGFALTFANIFVIDTEKKNQLAFSIVLAPILDRCYQLYVVSFITGALSIITMGFGTSSEIDYLNAYTIFGFINIIFMTLVVWAYVTKEKIRIKYKENLLHKSSSNDKSTKDIQEDEIQDIKDLIEFKNIINRNNSAGGMATFAAGYLFYNIVTFTTDVSDVVYNDDIFIYNWIFLFSNGFTVVLGLSSAVLDSVQTIICNSLPSTKERLEYLEVTKNISKIIVYAYKLSLLGWFVVFALFGFVKFRKFNYIPMYYSIAGVIGSFIGSQYLHIKFEYVKALSIESTVQNDEKNSNNPALVRPKILSFLSSNILFLGGFAYYTLDYFVFNNRPYEIIYIHFMSLSFITSMWILFWCNDYNNKFLYCGTTMKKIKFAEITYSFFGFTISVGFISVLTILIGFSVLGDQKFITNYEDIAYLIQFGSYLAIIIIIIVLYWLISTYNLVNINNDKSVIIEFDYKTFDSKLRNSVSGATFVAGNVCFELLFSEALSSYGYNTYYFFMTTLCFVTAVVAVATTTTFGILIDFLDSENKKMKFGSKVHFLKNMVFYLMFASLASWLMACIALGEVKYKHKLYLFEPSSIICSLFFLVVLNCFVDIRNKCHITKVLTEEAALEKNNSIMVINPMSNKSVTQKKNIELT